jgi:hypothetical protein
MRNARVIVLTAACLAVAAAAEAKVTRLVIEERKSPAFDGRSFGAAGPYELLTGHIDGELDPADKLNAIVTDIALAPRNASGKIEYSATFALARPVDPAKTSGVMLYQVPNRGMPLNFEPDAAGDVMLISGWQGDMPPNPGRQTIRVPVARNADGSPVTGPALATFVNMAPGSKSLSLLGGIGVLTSRPEPIDLDPAKAHLTKHPLGGAPVAIPASDWAFADCETVPFPGKPDPHRLCLKEGFDPAFLYQLSYGAKDPPVLGIGFAATRDINAFFRFAAKDDAGTANPLAGQIKAAIGIGFSQSGNFIRSFIHLGFNQAETGQRVWDGAESNIAGRQVALNLRFAAPGGAADEGSPGSEGVLWWEDHDDFLRHNGKAGLLDRCRATQTCPKIFDLFGASEFWGLRMSPDLVGPAAKADIPLPPEVRRYYSPGITHGGGRGGFALYATRPALSVNGACVLPDNPNPSTDTTRALTLALIDWVVKGAEPPPSRYPQLAKGELVSPTAAAMGFPAIPGAPRPDGKINPLVDYDFGPSFNANDMSGVMSLQPPLRRGAFPSVVPRVDSDGNELGGVPSVLRQVPLGTYLGWNETASGYYKGDGCGFTGGYIPFAATKAERLERGDPRPSLEERYKSHDDYVARVRAAAAKLVEGRFLLAQDADRIVREADESAILRPH